MQEQGLDFLPMEHRIKRDWKTWRAHMKGGKLLGYNAYLEGHRATAEAQHEKFPPHQAPQAYAPMSRDADAFPPLAARHRPVQRRRRAERYAAARQLRGLLRRGHAAGCFVPCPNLSGPRF